MTGNNGGSEDDLSNNDNAADDATHIITDEGNASDEATKIMPLRSGISPATPPQENVIGIAEDEVTPVAAKADSVEATNQSQSSDDEAKTVLLPAGKVQPAEKDFDPAVGWLVITKGPGRGSYCPVFYGQNSLGRGSDQRIQLNFGDKRIARDTHAFIIYDDVTRNFHLRDTGKANLVRLNNAPVLAPTILNDRDQIIIGETTLLFVALCGAGFDWMASQDEQNPQADK